MKLSIPNFSNKRDLFLFLIENKSTLIAEKKMQIKFSDALTYYVSDSEIEKGVVCKANTPIENFESLNEIKVKVVINTTNILDSHSDVHIPGLWKKTLSENKLIKFLQEHEMSFKGVIADGKDLSVYTKNYTWMDLGFKFVGSTEALVFDAIVRKSRNPFMFEQYAKGYVTNHSVGMQYISMVLCINEKDLDDGAEYEAWQKYFPMVANQEYALERGYFWAVKEAKIFEGSAVVLGSNYATPTLSNNEIGKGEPGNHSQKTQQPDNSTVINYDYLQSNLLLI